MKTIKMKFLNKKEVRSLKSLGFVVEFVRALDIGARLVNLYKISVGG